MTQQTPDDKATALDSDPTLIDRLRSENGNQVRQETKQALEQLEAKLRASERAGVAPHLARQLSAALLAVKSAHATLDAINVGTAAERK